ncbi:MAG: DUF58 domain-containing protein [Thermovirgaceae bacterium]|jgi:uncharacterized protein (DUF58 family)|nr:DUF58 domain-containing protein [Synergistales bacterium]MDI9393877.1 DUF58 domain-containing protein [Synergistota bacterium]MDY0178793.1 DUF58 domain-containing protein [Synergistaceae bacterium]MDD3830250.1 DUF58 domain-containing protein [Synergistales bacterium]MDD5515144.1 DUF58 domain-containing protein [Synergistales bacterium]
MEEFQRFTSLYTFPSVRVFAAAGVILLLARGLYLPASFLIAILLILGSCRLWADYGLRRLVTSREAHPVRLFPGDEASLSVFIRNGKWLPVAIEVMQPFPDGLEVTSRGGIDEVSDGQPVTFLGKSGEDLSTFRIRGISRGCYKVPPGKISSRDILGLFNRERTFGGATEILVYPALLDFEDPDLAQHYLMGDIRSDRPFMPDPTRVSSLRDYTPDTPAGRIHWKASARHGKLLAKVLEHTADLRLCITLDGDSFDTPGPSMEEALSLAATLAVWADRKRIPFGLVSNVSRCGMSGPVSIPVGSGPTQVRLALEALARAELPVALPFGEFLRKESRLLPWGTTVISIRGEIPAEALSEVTPS